MLFNLALEFLLGGQDRQVFCRKQLFVAFEYGVAGDVFACLGAKHNADCGIVALGAPEFVVHSHIHIHLPYILVGNRSHFQVYKHISFEHYVVENQVDKVVLCVGSDKLLTPHKGKTTPHFHNELLQVIDDGRFKLLL